MSVDAIEIPMALPANTGGDVPRMLTVQDVAAIIKCSARTVYRLADSGRMPPPSRLGALARWNAAVIATWIAQGCPSCLKNPQW